MIVGSKLFHAAALWPLEAAAHIVDMVFFASVAENNELVTHAKEQFRNGIVIPRERINGYIREADSILIGPGLPRPDGAQEGDDDTRDMTYRLLTQFPDKRWVIDGGSLQTMEPSWIPKNAILTPHTGEFEALFQLRITDYPLPIQIEKVKELAVKYACVIVLKGHTDIICSPHNCVTIAGGNQGMTKGGTGDVLAGVAAALYAKNDAFLAACASSYFNKKASELLYQSSGYWYSTSELVSAIPRVMKQELLS